MRSAYKHGLASGHCAAHRSTFSIGGVSVQLASDGGSDVSLPPALVSFEANASPSDVKIQIEWKWKLEAPTERRLFDSGCTWRLYESEIGFQFDFHVPALGSSPYKRLLIDEHFRSGRLLMSEEAFGDSANSLRPLTYPLDELLIMHRLTQEKAIELHGAGIITADGVGNLFVGHSGAGKSTTTRLWTGCEDVEVLSDDRIIVRRDEGLALETPLRASGAASVQGVLRLRDRPASPTGHSAQDDSISAAHSFQDDKAQKRSPPLRFAQGRNDKAMRMYGTPWHGEAMYASPNSASLARIFILEHGHGNVLTRLSSSQAVAELFARSFVPFHRHEYVESALTFLQEVVEAVPVYRYAFEPDQRAVDTILNLRD